MSRSDVRHDGPEPDQDPGDAIERAAKQLVMREPPARLYTAVMADIRWTSHERRTPWGWTSRRWAFAGISAAALLVVAVLVWYAQRPAPRDASVAAARPTPPTVTPPADAAPTVLPSSPSRSTPSAASRQVRRTYVAQPHPQGPVQDVAVSTIDVHAIPVAAIPGDNVPVVPIAVTAIPVDMDQGGRISVSAIAVDGK